MFSCSHVLNSCYQALETDSPGRMLFAHRNGTNTLARVRPATVRGPPLDEYLNPNPARSPWPALVDDIKIGDAVETQGGLSLPEYPVETHVDYASKPT